MGTGGRDDGDEALVAAAAPGSAERIAALVRKDDRRKLLDLLGRTAWWRTGPTTAEVDDRTANDLLAAAAPVHELTASGWEPRDTDGAVTRLQDGYLCLLHAHGTLLFRAEGGRAVVRIGPA
jgi:hypothetical protein